MYGVYVAFAKLKHCTHELNFFGKDTFLFIFRVATCNFMRAVIDIHRKPRPRHPYKGNSQIASKQSALQMQSKERAYGYKYN